LILPNASLPHATDNQPAGSSVHFGHRMVRVHGFDRHYELPAPGRLHDLAVRTHDHEALGLMKAHGLLIACGPTTSSFDKKCI